MRKLLQWIVLLALLALGATLGYFYTKSTSTIREEATVVMQQIKDIHELALVESELAEIYDYKDYWGMDVSFFRKKALIKVNGTVKAGINLDNLILDWDYESHEVTLIEIPEVEILSVEHDLEYYDIQEGSFNSFDAEKLTEIQDGAKKFLAHKAVEGQILERAKARQAVFLRQVQLLIERAGWTWNSKSPSDSKDKFPINTKPDSRLPN